MNRSTPPPTDPPNEDPWTGPSQWFNYRCRSCNHIDWVEDIGALAFPPEYPGGCAVLQCPQCGGDWAWNDAIPPILSQGPPD